MAETTAPRLPFVDLVRGLVMVLMVLDHTRDFFSDNLRINPADPGVTTPLLFATRWVSHFCATAFVLLAGVGAGLAEERGQSKAQLAKFLITRGLWLVILELTLVRLGFFFSFDFTHMLGMVIWVLGWSMVLLAGLQFLPRPAILLFALALIAGHNYFDLVTPAHFGRLSWLWTVLHHHQAAIELPLGYLLHTPYKIVPWVGVMALGYAMVPLLRRRGELALFGALVTVWFCFLRYSNRYGDPLQWVRYDTLWQTVASFLNCEKYPPSLCYLLMTLGPIFLALAAFDRPPGWLGRRLIVFGRVPLFYYLLHLPLIHGLAVFVDWYRFGTVSPWLLSPPQSAQAPASYGYNLGVVYAMTLVVLMILYPLCVWFGAAKRRDRTGILSYF